MSDDRLKIDDLRTGTELYYMSSEGVCHCIVLLRDGLQVQVQDIKRPRNKFWLTARQIEFECSTKEDLDTPSESVLSEEDKQDLKEGSDGWPDVGEEDDPADWWKQG